MSKDTVSLSSIINSIVLEEEAPLDARTYERAFRFGLASLGVDASLLQSASNHYEIPKRFCPFVRFLLQQYQLKDPVVRFIGTPKPHKRPTVEQILSFYYDFLMWLKYEMELKLSFLDPMFGAEEVFLDYAQLILSRLPSGDEENKLEFLCQYSDIFSSSDGYGIFLNCRLAFTPTQECLSQHELLTIVTDVRKFIGYPSALQYYILRRQFQETSLHIPEIQVSAINSHIVRGDDLLRDGAVI